MLASVTGLCLLIATLAWVFLLRPQSVYEYETPDTDSTPAPSAAPTLPPVATLVNDPLLVLVGGFLMLAFTCIGLTAALRVFWLVRRPPLGPSADLSAAVVVHRPNLDRPLTAAGARANAPALATALFVLALLALSCCSFSGIWNYSAHSYFKATSPYSLVDGRVNDNFIFKVYTDVVVFYVVLAAVALAGFAAHTVPSLAAVANHRLRAPLAQSPRLRKYHPFPHGVKIGELAVVAVGLGLTVFWVVYWSHIYDRITNEADASHSLPLECCAPTPGAPVPHPPTANGTCATAPDKHGQVQVAARVSGHLTSLFVALLLLPVARNSLWESLLGISFERALKYHRMVGGALAWTMLTVHMLLWDTKWLLEGNLFNNIFTLDQLQITSEWMHYDNFTMPLVHTAWLAVTAMLLVAVFWRRTHYRFFYMLHHTVSIFFFVVCVIHAWDFW